MAFFLIGRGSENNVRTLSDSLFATRQEAMTELSRLSADPAFHDWDADVFVLDLDAGVPVLLVRPQDGGANPPSQASTGDADVWVADLQPQDEASVESAEPVPAESAEPQTGAEDAELRDALLRTTQHMTAEGIEPPASAGFAPADAQDLAAEGALSEEPPAPAADEALEPESGEAAPVVAMEATEPEPLEPLAVAAELPAAEPVAASIAVPEEPAAPQPTEAAAPLAEEPIAPEPTAQDEGATAPAWPWDSLGPEPATEEAQAPQDVPEAAEALPEPAGEAETAAASKESDFILDLEAVQPVALESSSVSDRTEEPPAESTVQEPVPPSETPVAEVASPMADYTCGDCVYVETCPNQGQRLPKDCGSFQWR